jgi:hypothetical protein
MSAFEQRNSLLGLEFDRYIREHPAFLEKIPDKAQVVLLLEESNRLTLANRLSM